MGMKMRRAKGSRLLMTSFGRPFVTIVAACDVKLLTIWLYVSPADPVAVSIYDDTPQPSQLKDGHSHQSGYHRNTLQALNPLRTSSTH